MGHRIDLDASHRSTHSMWYRCPHGNTRTYSSSTNCSKHTEHIGSPRRESTTSTNSSFSNGGGPLNFAFECGHLLAWFALTSRASSFTDHRFRSADLPSTFSNGNAPMIFADNTPSFDSGPESSSSSSSSLLASRAFAVPPRFAVRRG